MPRATKKGRKRVDIPAALPHQKPVLDHEARFKMLRCGRRWGKTRLKFRAAVTGHGPTVDGRRKYEGISSGKKILWVVADYPQGRGIWEEEIKPRFSGAYKVKLNESEHSVLLPNAGHLEIRSAESIDGVRGRKYDGVLCDEAAFWEFLYAWRRVIRPTLTDTGGWAIIGSTTEIGSDFNQIIKEVEEGKRGEQWKAFRGRSRDNPKLSQEELDLLYAEYPPGGSDMLQELEAELLDAHGSLFLEEYFKYADQMNEFAMWVNGIRMPWVEILVVVDLASSIKQTADYTCIMVVGITANRKVGVLDLKYDHWEGPRQIDEVYKTIQRWKPMRAKIEAVQYQATAVQHLAQRQLGNTALMPCYPDKDKRSRAVPWAAAMARGDVFWNKGAPYMKDVIEQHKKFPNGKEGSRYIQDHDDIVDCGSLVGEELIPSGGAWVMRKMGG